MAGIGRMPRLADVANTWGHRIFDRASALTNPF